MSSRLLGSGFFWTSRGPTAVYSCQKEAHTIRLNGHYNMTDDAMVCNRRVNGLIVHGEYKTTEGGYEDDWRKRYGLLYKDTTYFCETSSYQGAAVAITATGRRNASDEYNKKREGYEEPEGIE